MSIIIFSLHRYQWWLNYMIWPSKNVECVCVAARCLGLRAHNDMQWPNNALQCDQHLHVQVVEQYRCSHHPWAAWFFCPKAPVHCFAHQRTMSGGFAVGLWSKMFLSDRVHEFANFFDNFRYCMTLAEWNSTSTRTIRSGEPAGISPARCAITGSK